MIRGNVEFDMTISVGFEDQLANLNTIYFINYLFIEYFL